MAQLAKKKYHVHNWKEYNASHSKGKYNFVVSRRCEDLTDKAIVELQKFKNHEELNLSDINAYDMYS
jgi:hypothetical protein